MAERNPTAPKVVDTLGEPLSEVKCDTRELETTISRLGEIVNFQYLYHVTPHSIPPL